MKDFKQSYIESIWLPGWYKARAELYGGVAKWDEKEVEEVFFNFSKPNAGWIDMSIYSNGKKLHSFPMSAALDPFNEMRTWMEDIANDFKLSADLNIDAEGRNIVLHYERLSLAEVVVRRKHVHEDRDQDQWESLNAVTEPEYGLFFVYDTATESVPVLCYCKTKQFLHALYVGLLEYASRSEAKSSIRHGWYYLDHSHDNWTLYNTIKSPLIEWCIYSDHGYRHLRPSFETPARIKETVHMWAEWSDGLFWHQRGGCCGNAEKFFVDTEGTVIDLSSMPEIRQWYDEFDTRVPEEPWPSEDYNAWLNRGWNLAIKIRQLLPESVDLFYEWRHFGGVPGRYGTGRDLPHIVPDLRLVKSDNQRFNLLLF